MVHSKTHKRPEECYKFIFTRTLKNLLKEFQQKNTSKQDLIKKFYNHYFKADSELKNIPIENYYYPLTKVKTHANQTLNSKYFALVFGCREFKNHFLHYVEDRFISDYNKEISKKLYSLAQKFEQWNEELRDEICKKYFPEKLICLIKAYSIKN